MSAKVSNETENFIENDGFKLVTSKRNKNKKAYQIHKTIEFKNEQQTKNLPDDNNTSNEVLNLNEDCLELYKRVEDCKKKLKDYDQHFYWSKVQMKLKKLLKIYFTEQIECSNLISIVCYGLGSVDENISSRYQLALLLLIIDELNAACFSLNNNKKQKYSIDLIEIYDPVFNQIDKHLLQNIYKFKLNNKNNQCFKSVHSLNENKNLNNNKENQKLLNLFYMPHCGKALYNNLLYANWSKAQLSSMVILGNRFSTILLNTLEEKMKKYYGFIRDGSLLFDEVNLNYECELTNAFNDLSFQIFDSKKFNQNNSMLFNSLISEELNYLPFDNDTPSNCLVVHKLKKPVYEDNEEIF
jgi:hypothetical protein